MCYKNLFVILDSCIVSLFCDGNRPVNLRRDNPDVAAAAPPPELLGSNSMESPDYYEEACYYHHEWSVTHDLYSEATKEVVQLQIHLDAQQVDLAAFEEELIIARTRLFEARAIVAGMV
jgi:hypothetical protein